MSSCHKTLSGSCITTMSVLVLVRVEAPRVEFIVPDAKGDAALLVHQGEVQRIRGPVK